MGTRVRTVAAYAKPQAVVCALAMALGCQAPAARFTSIAADARCPSPSTVLAKQVVCDTVWTWACKPVSSGLNLAAEPAEHLYLAARGCLGKRLVLPLCAGPAPDCNHPDDSDPPDSDPSLFMAKDEKAKPACIALLTSGSKALAALEQLLDAATCSIDILMFQWDNDSLGNALADRVVARAGPHLHVRVLVDGGGNLVFGETDGDKHADLNGVLCRLAKNPYVEVIRTRNPCGRFDHRKLVVVDGCVAWTGGRNFTKDSFFSYHDASLVVQGPLALDLAEAFEKSWYGQGGKTKALPIADCRLPIETLESAISNRQSAIEGLDVIPNALGRVVNTAPLCHQIEKAVYDAVDRAKCRVYIENFAICDGLLVYKLAQARRRGVDVRVVLALADSCTYTVSRANRVTANRLLRAGVKVYVHPELTHTKAAAVDGCWAYLGTGNFDALSFRRNRELGLAIHGGPLVREVEDALFMPDFQPAWELKKPLPVGRCDYFLEMVACFWL